MLETVIVLQSPGILCEVTGRIVAVGWKEVKYHILILLSKINFTVVFKGVWLNSHDGSTVEGQKNTEIELGGFCITYLMVWRCMDHVFCHWGETVVLPIFSKKKQNDALLKSYEENCMVW